MMISVSNQYGRKIGKYALEGSFVSGAFAFAQLHTTENSSTMMNRKRSFSYLAMADKSSEQKQQKMQDKANGAWKGIYSQNFKRRGEWKKYWQSYFESVLLGKRLSFTIENCRFPWSDKLLLSAAWKMHINFLVAAANLVNLLQSPFPFLNRKWWISILNF